MSEMVPNTLVVQSFKDKQNELKQKVSCLTPISKVYIKDYPSTFTRLLEILLKFAERSSEVNVIFTEMPN